LGCVPPCGLHWLDYPNKLKPKCFDGNGFDDRPGFGEKLRISKGDNNIFKRLNLVILMVSFGLRVGRAQVKPALPVHAFTLASDVKFLYEMNQLQTEAIEEIKLENGAKFDVFPDSPTSQDQVYILDREVLEWHKGNTAERMLIALGSVAGRESAKIHHWLRGKNLQQHRHDQANLYGQRARKTSGHSGHPSGLKSPNAQRMRNWRLNCFC